MSIAGPFPPMPVWSSAENLFPLIRAALRQDDQNNYDGENYGRDCQLHQKIYHDQPPIRLDAPMRNIQRARGTDFLC